MRLFDVRLVRYTCVSRLSYAVHVRYMSGGVCYSSGYRAAVIRYLYGIRAFYPVVVSYSSVACAVEYRPREPLTKFYDRMSKFFIFLSVAYVVDVRYSCVFLCDQPITP